MLLHPRHIHLLLLTALMTFTTFLVSAQQGIGTDEPHKSAALQIESTKRGVLIPRVSLTGETDGTTMAQGNVQSLLVYNTQTVGNLYPGFYYWENGKWNRLTNLDDLQIAEIEPWQIQNTTDKATDNDQNIYQEGNVAIGKTHSFIEVPLDVLGSIRGGDLSGVLTAAIGENSIAVGKDVIASGKYSQAFGNKSEATAFGAFAGGGFQNSPTDPEQMGGKATGMGSFAFGMKTEANDNYAVAFGRESKADGTASVALGRESSAMGSYSTALGRRSLAVGNYSSALGRETKANSAYELVFGYYNFEFSGGSTTTFNLNDPLLQIGDGTSNSDRSNALTLMKNGKLSLGMVGGSPIPTERLDVMEGNVRVRDLRTSNPATLGNINTDHIVVSDSQGVLKHIASSSILELEPFNVQSTTNKATDNNENIYQMGSIAIGKSKVIDNAVLDVKGSIHAGEVLGSGATTQMGLNSIAVGNEVVSGADYTAVFGHKTQATGEGSFAGGGFTDGSDSGPGGKASGKNAFAYGRLTEAEGDFSTVFGRNTKAETAYQTVIGRYNEVMNGTQSNSNTNWYAMDPLFIIGSGTANNSRRNAITVLKNSQMGVGITGKPTYQLEIGDRDGTGKVRIQKLHSTTVNNNNRLVVVDNTGVLGSMAIGDLPSGGGSNDLWNKTVSHVPATSISDDTYHTGRIAIKKNNIQGNVNLDVQGSIRGGQNNTNPVGDNSFAVGSDLIASGDNSAAFGYGSEATWDGAFAAGGYYISSSNRSEGGTASGRASFAIGNGAIASGRGSFAGGGTYNEPGYTWNDIGGIASGESSFAFGIRPQASGDYSVAFGKETVAPAVNSVSVGQFNKILTGQNTWNVNNPIFQVGVGVDDSNRANAITALKSGWVGIGQGAFAPWGAEKLRVDGSIRTASQTYADYVFESYYDGVSELKPDYQFSDLETIKTFIEEHKHLPGILPASALQRNERGEYEFNLTELAVQSLEKVEELYLHTIEQEEKIKNLEKRLEKLEERMIPPTH